MDNFFLNSVKKPLEIGDLFYFFLKYKYYISKIRRLENNSFSLLQTGCCPLQDPLPRQVLVRFPDTRLWLLLQL